MFPVQLPVINPDDFSRCEDRMQVTDPGKSLSPTQKRDVALKESIYHAFWKDDVLRALEYDEIDVHVRNGVAYLSGHIVSITSQRRITNAIRAIPGVLGIQNNLVLDDKLTREVAASLGNLEHTYGCKFFTGASHGVVSMDGIVGDHTVKLLAEKQAARHPNVRGVINHVRVSGVKPGLKDQPFLQPTIGETIYFLNGISGIVEQVIINPNSRRVIAMTIRGNFTDQRYGINLLTDGKTPHPEHLIVVPMNEVRYLTKVSGFLHINSDERNRYTDFDSASFGLPNVTWVPPYPYCADEVLFPVELQDMENHILQQSPATLLPVASKEQLLWEQLLANDSLGG
jgi:osmotically-inducible protein OsmY